MTYDWTMEGVPTASAAGRAGLAPGPQPDPYRLHADICKVLTDPKRLMILEALRDGEQSVGALAGRLAATLANASQHLTVLRSAGLVEARRSGTTVHYRLSEPRITEACDIIRAIVASRLAGRVVPETPRIPAGQLEER